MAEMEKIVEKKVYEEGHRKNYATKGEALGVGIPALALGGLAFLQNGGLGNLFGCGCNGQRTTDGPTAFQAWQKECDDLRNAREIDTQEKFGIYKAVRDLYDSTQTKMTDMGFGLYKGQRDLYDTLNERFGQKVCDLEKKVAVMEATRPYQDKLIQCEIDRAFGASVNYTDKKTCRAIYGVVGLPSTPTVTVLEGANPFGCNPCNVSQG